MKDLPYSCECQHCHRTIEFDGKMLGETIACPACNQDMKLYGRSSDLKRKPIVHKLDRDRGVTECCGLSIFKCPKCDTGTFDDLKVTCPGAAPPIIEKKVIMEKKDNNGIFLGVACAVLFLMAACVFTAVTSSLISPPYRATYRHASGIISSTAQEYGLRDHMTGNKRSRVQVERLAHSLGISDLDRTNFVVGYYTGWNLIR